MGDNKFQTSFIPKRSLEENGSVHVKTPRNVLQLASYALIAVTLLAAAGVFSYSYILDRRVSAAREAVIAKEKQFDYAAVQRIVDTDSQLKAVSTLLKNHLAPSAIFDVLEANTLKNLRFSSFEFTYLSPTKVALSMKGQARTFGAVARQEELFASASSTKAYFKNPIFSDLNLDERGNVIFSFLTTIDPTLITYKPRTAVTPAATVPVATTTPARTVSPTPTRTSTTTTITR